MYKYVLFDLDGTISDSSEGITKGIQLALKGMGVDVANRSELRRFIGPPLDYSFKRYMNFSDEQSKEATKIYRDYYSKTGLFENVAYDGMESLLIKIKNSGRKVAVTTSKPEKFSVQILEKFGLAKYFDIIAGSSLDGSRGTKQEVLEYALEQFGNPDLKDVVLVGDTRFDAEGANKIGIDCVGVLYGFGTFEELEAEGVRMIAATVEEIYDFL